MPQPTKHDLSTIAPHLRPQVAQRIAAIEQFLQAPGRAQAERQARELSMSTTGFYALVRAWRDDPVATSLPASGVRRPRRISLTQDQLAVIEQAEAACASHPMSEVVREAWRIAQKRNLDLPTDFAVKAQIERLRLARRNPRETIGGADLLLSHCRIDVPVLDQDQTFVDPVAAFLIATTPDRAVALGVALHPSEPNVATSARALLDAAARADAQPYLADPPAKRLVVASPIGFPHGELVSALDQSPFQVRSVERDQATAMSPVVLLGRSFARLKLKSRLGIKARARPNLTLARGVAPYSLDEAEQFVRARLAAALEVEGIRCKGGKDVEWVSLETELRRLADR